MRRLLLLSLSLILAGCASAPPRPEPGDAADHRRAVLALEDWSVLGRAAINMPEESASVGLFWRQRGERYRIVLRGPIGSGTLRLEGDARSVTVRTSDGREAAASSPEQLLRAQTGLQVPVSNLRYWIRGTEAPQAGAETELGERGRARRIRQDGWTVRYQEYAATEPALPRRLRLSNGEIDIRIVIQQWDLTG